MDSLRVTTVQTDLIWENKTANFTHLAQLLRGLETDVVVLPEMFTTGFSMNPKAHAEPLFGATFEWLRAQSAQLNAAVTGSFIGHDNGHYYNRLIWMQPDGNYAHYDKRHRFTLAGEHLHYTEGSNRVVVTWRGWRICPLICYDLRFPVWSRNVFDARKAGLTTDSKADEGYYDALIYVANWPQRRAQAWKSLLVGRAVENQAYVVGVNRIGHDGNGIYHSGDTSVVDFAGDVLYTLSDTEGVATTVFSKPALLNFRTKLNFLADQDAFSLDLPQMS